MVDDNDDERDITNADLYEVLVQMVDAVNRLAYALETRKPAED